MAKVSAGLLMYRTSQGQVEVLLGHPGGPYWTHKDSGAWSIPKGEIRPEEQPLQAACREFTEETGIEPQGEFISLRPQRYLSGKTVQAWAFTGDFDPRDLKSNLFGMEWPPHSGQIQEFPEIDRVEWFSLETAREKILSGQKGFLDELETLLSPK